MNKVFKVIWSQSLGTWVAVSELTKSASKEKSSRALRRAASVAALGLGASLSGGWHRGL